VLLWGKFNDNEAYAPGGVGVCSDLSLSSPATTQSACALDAVGTRFPDPATGLGEAAGCASCLTTYIGNPDRGIEECFGAGGKPGCTDSVFGDMAVTRQAVATDDCLDLTPANKSAECLFFNLRRLRPQVTPN
jgi:hypothetical protein